MKTRKLTILNLLLMMIGHLAGVAQNISDWVTEDKVWNYVSIDHLGASRTTCYQDPEYCFDGVALFDGLEYHAFRWGGSQTIAYLRQEGPRLYLRGIQEIEGEVYPITEAYIDQKSDEWLLYDFSLKPGDHFQTLVCGEQQWLRYGVIEGTVVGYYELNVGGQVLRVQRYEVKLDWYAFTQTVDVIEGVGPMRGLLCAPQINGFIPSISTSYWYPYTVDYRVSSETTDSERNSSTISHDDAMGTTRIVVFNPFESATPALNSSMSGNKIPEMSTDLFSASLSLPREIVNPDKRWSYQAVWTDDSPDLTRKYIQMNDYGFNGVTVIGDLTYSIFCNSADKPMAYMRQDGDRVYVRGFEKDGVISLTWDEEISMDKTRDFLLYDLSSHKYGDNCRILVAADENLSTLMEVDAMSHGVSILSWKSQEYAMHTYRIEDAEGNLNTVTVVEGMGPTRGMLCAPQISDISLGYVFPYLISEYSDSGVSEIETDKSHQDNKHSTYDLHGRKVTNPVPGTIYIRDGRKFVAR